MNARMDCRLFTMLMAAFFVLYASGAAIDNWQTKLANDITGCSVPDNLKAFAKKELLPLCTNTVFVREVKLQNSKGVSLDEIKKIDKAWIDAEDELPIHVEKLGNACAKEIKSIVAKHTVIIEAFVMDNQGAVVGENNMTSDYWQGDEAKWQNSYNNAKGGIDVGKAKLDSSANVVLQQVSLPIVAQDGSVIGAVTYGIAVDRL
ncbi:MAG: hypothetical protein JW941_04955 [Candidatus Coatesbacteria bacterium]|nr:hypothetical protein [Candidatus Coatesbacteria bacterium]